MDDFIPHKTTALWLFHQQRRASSARCVLVLLAQELLPVRAESNFKLYLFVWNESRATGRVVAFPARAT